MNMVCWNNCDLKSARAFNNYDCRAHKLFLVPQLHPFAMRGHDLQHFNLRLASTTAVASSAWRWVEASSCEIGPLSSSSSSS